MGKFRMDKLLKALILFCMDIGRICNCDVFNIGFMSTGENGLPFQEFSSAINIAIEDFQAEGWLSGHTINMTYRDDRCDAKVGAALAVQMSIDEKVYAIFGSQCSQVTITAGYFLSYSNTAALPQSSTDEVLSNKNTFNTVIRVKPSYDKLGAALVELFLYNGWSRAVMLITLGGECVLAGEAIQNKIREAGRNVSLSEYIRAPPDFTTSAVDEYLDNLMVRGRVILLCGPSSDIHLLLARAKHRGLSPSEYTFIIFDLILDNAQMPWEELGPTSEAEREEFKNVYTGVKLFTMPYVTGPAVNRLYSEIPMKLQSPPWNTVLLPSSNNKRNKDALFLYDLTKLWLLILNETLAEGSDPHNGTLIFHRARNKRFSGASGEVIMDDTADRAPEFWFWSLNPGDVEFHVRITFDLLKPEGEQITVRSLIYWGTDNELPPPAVPACGFFNEFCPSDNSVRNVIIIAACVGTLLLVIIVIVFVLIYKRRKLEQELSQMLWKIKYEDIQFTKQRAGSVIGASMKSMKSIHSVSVSSIASSTTSKRRSNGATEQIFAEVGLYKGNMVAIKRINATSITLDREDLLDFKTMREMSHDNINPFVGATVDLPDISYLMAYCPKGSLQDIVEHDEIGLDWMFKSSLMSDIVNGLVYIHKTSLGSHGGLKSSNCLVDGRWTLKISGYGLYALKSRNSTSDIGDYEKYKKMLWTAPELLRSPNRPRYGTPKGDVYSFAIILQELVFRNMPFFLDLMTPKEVIEKVVAGETKPYRPVLPDISGTDTNPEIVGLIQECWAENPDDRPDFDGVRKRLRVMNKGKKINIMDQMLNKMEAYTNNLEGIVQSRTAELTEEKKKTDKLLYRMLPESVADSLKHGKTVDPELYDEVSIYFSDIVGFTSISSASTPMQVVDLLNDLYTLFDDILDTYDVYKVETIGDAYMVGSGLPKKNGNKHVAEIACMSLDLLEAVSTKFKIRHRPELRMKLRSGFHTGPVAAGVVGLTMPRYCLFGESVNIASLMESSGEALKVQCSQASHAALMRIGGFKTELRDGYENRDTDTRYWLIEKV